MALEHVSRELFPDGLLADERQVGLGGWATVEYASGVILPRAGLRVFEQMPEGQKGVFGDGAGDHGSHAGLSASRGVEL